MASNTTQFDNIYHGLSPDVGKIRFAPAGLAWKAIEGEGSIQIAGANVKWAEWLRVARHFQLRIGQTSKKAGKNGERKRDTFDGFRREDHEKLVKLLQQHYDITLETKEVSFKGWNWGATDFQGEDLAFLVSNKLAFEFPLSGVSNTNIAGKTEVSLEFGNPSTTNGVGKKVAKPPDELVEIRFYVPGTLIKEAGSDEEDAEKPKKAKKVSKEGEEAGSDDEEEEQEEEEEEQNAAQRFHSLIADRASLTSQTAAGALIVSFDEILVTTPRGRYDIDMYQDFLRLRGKTYDYKIMYSSITRMLVLSKDEQHQQFVVGLEPPIRQGQTKYSYLIMQFEKNQDMEAELNIEDDVLTEKYEGKLDKHFDGPAWKVVSSVFRGLSGVKLSGSKDIASHGIKCNLKANQGEMHLLDKSILFIGKSPVFLELNDIHQVKFSRVGAGVGTAVTARTFDLTIEAKSGPDLNFSAFNKDDHPKVDDFFKSKHIRVKNMMADDVITEMIGEDDDDEEMQSVASDESDEPTIRRGADVDDEDSEEDADFQASSSDGGSPSEHSGSGSEAGSDAESKPAKSKAKPKAKKATEGDSSKPKPKPKPKARKSEGSGGEDSPPKKKKKTASAPAADGDGDDAAPSKPKPKPKAKPKPKPKSNPEVMDVDDEPASPTTSKKTEEPAAKPRPKPKPKKPESEDGPKKKKQKKSASDSD